MVSQFNIIKRLVINQRCSDSKNIGIGSDFIECNITYNGVYIFLGKCGPRGKRPLNLKGGMPYVKESKGHTNHSKDKTIHIGYKLPLNSYEYKNLELEGRLKNN